MTDTFDPQTRSRIMSRVRQRDTGPELKVRRALHAAGYRFRLNRSDLPGRPDIILPRFRVAVFVNGCFWHGHDCPRFKWPKSNEDYWHRKITHNVARDAVAQHSLKEYGWAVHVIWTCNLEDGIQELLTLLAGMRTRSV